MFKLNRKVEYALIALQHVVHKRPGELTTAKELAETYGCSFDTIARVLQIMTQKGWLQSIHGSAGGYLLKKDLAKMSFYDLSLSLLGPIKLVKCLSASAGCQLKNRCNIIHPIQNLNLQLVEFYKGITLFDLLLNPQSLERSSNVITNMREYKA